MYNEIVSKARSLARSGLRMEMVNSVRQGLMRLNQTKDKLTKFIEEIKLEILSNDFEVTQINDADPKKAIKIEALAADKKHLEGHLEEKTENLKGVLKEIGDQEAIIDDIENGKVKVCAGALQEETDRLIGVITDEAARKAAALLTDTTPVENA